MAIWQFESVLVPRRNFSQLPQGRSLRDSCNPALWLGQPYQILLTELQTHLGPATPTWDSNSIAWGADDSTCLQLASFEGVIEELRLRVDMRFPDETFLNKVFRVAGKLDLVLLTESGDLVEPRLEWFKRSAGQSPAAEFVNDADQLFKNLDSRPIIPDDEQE